LKTLVAGSDLDIVTLTSMVDVYKTANPNVINAVNDHKNKINEMIDRLANFFSDDEDSGFCVNKLSATQL
jgi:VanZ family protein